MQGQGHAHTLDMTGLALGAGDTWSLTAKNSRLILERNVVGAAAQCLISRRKLVHNS